MKLQFLAFGIILGLTACGDRDFNGGTRSTTVKKSPASGDATANSGDSTPAGDNTPAGNVSQLPSVDGDLERHVDSFPVYLSGSFYPLVVKHEKYDFSLDVKSGSNSFSLVDTNSSKTQTNNQINRAPITDSFKQGTPGSSMKEQFVQQGKKGLVDILVVIDNSGSMSDEQQNLGSKMNYLLQAVNDAQWQIGVVTTSPKQNAAGADICQITIIKPSDADATTKFANAINAGLSGDGNEQGIRQAVNGLKCNENPWIRQDSSVAVLIVSDADNCSDGKGCGSNAWASEIYLEDYVEKTMGREINKNAAFYGIFSPPGNTCPSAESTGNIYQRLVNYKIPAGKSRYGRICDADYKSTLTMISNDIALLLKNQFELGSIPDSGSLTLKVDGQAIPAANYKINNKTISFVEGKEPANGKTLTAEYAVGSIPMFSKVVLTNAPAPETLSVKVGGSVLPASAYSVNGKELSFKTQPAALSSITVDYRVAGVLSNAFALDKAPINNSLKVLVNDKAPVGMSYDAAANQVLFNPAPGDGSVIKISYDYRVGPQLTYNVPVEMGAINLKLYDGANPIPFTITGNNITIQAANHAVGKNLLLKYDIPDGSVRKFILPSLPDANSAVISGGPASCSIGNGFTINGAELDASCAVNAKTNLSVNYNVSTVTRSYKLEGVNDPEKGKWKVFVDGVAVTDFSRIGDVITLSSSYVPKENVKVTVQYQVGE